jgi:hypothetical protein
MKNLVWLIVIGGLAYFGYTEWQKRQTPASAPTTADSAAPLAPSGAPAPQAAPVAQVEVPPPAPHVPRLAPSGTYYLLRPVSVKTDDGIIGILPGTKVTLVRATTQGLRVTDGQKEFDVATYQVTNDLDEAQQAQENDRSTQARVASSLAAPTRPAGSAPTAVPSAARAAVVPASTSGGLFSVPPGSSLDGKPYGVSRRR